MASISYPSGVRDHAFVWALLLSLSIHILLALRLPNIQFERPTLPQMLTVELVPPPKPQPLVTPEPAPLAPAPVPKPKPSKPKSVPVIKQRAVPVQVEPPHRDVSKPPVDSAPPPPVITAAPKPQTPPIVTAPPPPPEPPKPVGPSQQDIDTARSLYGNLLAREIAKHKQYPRAAQMRGWQGEAKVELQLDAGGNVLDSKIKDSSGHEILDQQALEMVKKAAPFPTPPEALRGHNFSIVVPVSFHLE